MGALTDILSGGKGGALGRVKNRKKKDDKKESSSSGSGDSTAGFYGSDITAYKRGGKVRKTGPAKLHKGEQVLTAKQAKRYRKGRAKR